MITPSDIFIFLLTVGFISLSGVLMPGPVFAASIIKGAERKHAGAWIALGHLSVEIPLILCNIAGLYYVFMNQWVKAGIGLVGGLFLIFLGIRMIQKRQDKESVKTAFPYHPFIAGVITTISNPYFILWWATVGGQKEQHFDKAFAQLPAAAPHQAVPGGGWCVCISFVCHHFLRYHFEASLFPICAEGGAPSGAPRMRAAFT